MSASGGESETPTHNFCHGQLVCFQLIDYKRGRQTRDKCLVTAVRREVSLLASVLDLFHNTLFTQPRRGQEVGFETEISGGLTGSHLAVGGYAAEEVSNPPAVVLPVGVVAVGAAGLKQLTHGVKAEPGPPRCVTGTRQSR